MSGIRQARLRASASGVSQAAGRNSRQDSFAQVMTGSGLFPWFDSEMLVAAFEHAERDGTLDRLLREARQRDAVAEAEAVSPEKLARAREVARTLGLCGSLYLMHGLLLPDTPGQQAIRAKIDELGLGEIVITAAQTFTKVKAANTLSLCLAPYFDHLSEQLNNVLTQHIDGIFRRPGEDDSAEDFMAGWITALQGAAGQET